MSLDWRPEARFCILRGLDEYAFFRYLPVNDERLASIARGYLRL